MKYANWIGCVSCLLLVAAVFQPWIFIPSVHLTISGWHAEGTNFGKPGLVPLVLCSIMAILFLLPKVWAKLVTILLATMQLAWMIRNYILLTTSFIGEVPDKTWVLQSLVPLSLVIILMSFLSKAPLKSTNPS
jgi:hypothetical protein